MEIYAEYDPATKSGQDNSGRKVKGTLGWVSSKYALNIEVRNYDRLFVTENMEAIKDDFKSHINPNSIEINRKAKIEQSLREKTVGSVFQIERIGYFRVDEDTTQDDIVLNRTITLRTSQFKKA